MKKLEGIERLFRGFFFIATIAFAAVGFVYFWHFGRQGTGLSNRVEDWAAFGEYMGGTLGGIFGLLAFIGVLITIVLLRGQLDFMRSQAHRDELQRLMASISANIDILLRKEPTHVPKEMSAHLKRSGAAVTVQHLIEGGGAAALKIQVLPASDTTHAALVKAVQSILPLDAGVLGIELDQLAQSMEAYLAAGGSAEVESIYNRRVRTYAAWLDAMGFNLSERVRLHFEIQHVQAIHRAASGPKIPTIDE